MALLLANHKKMEAKNAEASARLDDFKKEFLALVTKYDVDFLAFPQYRQNENGSFETVCLMTLVDKRSIPAISPMQKGDIIKK